MSGQPGPMLWTLLKSLKGPQTPNKQRLSQHALYLLLSSSKPRASGSQPQFATQPLPGASKASTGSYEAQIT